MLFNFISTLPKFSKSSAWYLICGNTQQIEQIEHGHSGLANSKVIWRDNRLAVYQFRDTGKKVAVSPQQKFVVIGDLWLSNASYFQDRSSSHLQIVANLWEQQGIDCLKLLQGMFGFVVWQPESEKLWLCRDAVGMQTLYYSSQNATHYISSQLSALLPSHSQELDLVALRDYLSCAFVPGERTLWQQVREIRPGSCLQLPNCETITYWQPQEQIIEESLDWHGEKLRSLLEQIVQESLPHNQPVGAFLSGGLDSSCITAIAAKLHDRTIHTYSIHFGKELPNELEFSNLVAKHCHTQHHILEITPEMMWENLWQTMAYLDDPIGDPLTVPNFLLGKLAKQSVDVILNGEGGDPCFGGPKNQPMLLNQLYSGDASSQPELLAAYLTSFQKCASQLSQIFKPEVWEVVKNHSSVFAEELYADGNYLNRLMKLNIKFKGADQILTKVNNLTSANGLSGRSPLFDQRVVAMSMQIPPQLKLAGAVEKAVLKQAVSDLLPSEIINRPKSGMMVPVQFWFREKWHRRTKSLLLHPKAAIAPYINQSLIKDWLSYKNDPWSRYGVKLWLLVSLEIWLQVNRKR